VIGAKPRADRYLGAKNDDFAGKPYAKHWRPAMDPLSDAAREAVARGALAAELFAPLEDARGMLGAREFAIENGYAVCDDGSARVAIRTPMPRVSPNMIDWWFGWHADEPQRYKLWHPRAHVHAEWRTPAAQDARGRARYVGRLSWVDEYVGGVLGRYAIEFVPPSSLGFDDAAFADESRATAICARVGFAELPLDFGWLVHHVRTTTDGAEMRSRFWMGGPHVRARKGGPLGALAVGAVGLFVKPTANDASALLVHCAEEMAHLATFLPALYDEARVG
jgi:hypothetical protein